MVDKWSRHHHRQVAPPRMFALMMGIASHFTRTQDNPCLNWVTQCYFMSTYVTILIMKCINNETVSHMFPYGLRTVLLHL